MYSQIANFFCDFCCLYISSFCFRSRKAHSCLFNFFLQSNIISTAKPVTEEAILDIFNNVLPESVGIADLGCSSGPNTLLVVSEILDVIYAKWQQLGRPCSPEFRVYLNDLIGNDFNNVFGSLPAFYNRLKEEKGSEFGPCFISGVPGSFYGRVFPSKSLHFVHSSSSLHWLSQVCLYFLIFILL